MATIDRKRQALPIMGVPVLPFESYADAVNYVESIISSGRQAHCVAVNPEKVYRAARDPRLLSVLRGADVGICDGIGVAFAARMLYGKRIRRCTGCDLFLHLIARAAERGWRVFLLGGSAEANAGACHALMRMHPDLLIVGRRDGYFTGWQPVVEQINRSRADVLFVALGSPKQEFWIARHRAAISARFCMGVGGSFDVVSGKAKRAPRIFRRTGTEFLYRLLSQPGRWRRQVALPLFLLSVAQERLSGRGCAARPPRAAQAR